MRTLPGLVQLYRHYVWRHLWVLVAALALVGALNLAGCPRPEYRDMIAGITLEDIDAIAADETLDAAGKTAALEALGIDDQQLIDAMLELAADAAAQAQ